MKNKKLIGALTGLTLLIGCSSVPNVKQKDLVEIEYGQEKNGRRYMLQKYDTDGDGYSDVEFYYLTKELKTGWYHILTYYGKDKNKDYEISEDEWKKY